MLDDATVLLTRIVQKQAEKKPKKIMGRLLLKCSITGKPAIIYVDFKDPVEITEFPRMVVECEDGLFDSLAGEVWEGPLEEPNLAESVELVEVDEDDEDGEEEDDDEDE
jgi:hypothetical protein